MPPKIHPNTPAKKQPQRCCALQPQLVRLLTLLTLLLADASVASTLAALMQLSSLSGDIPLLGVVLTGVGMFLYVVAAARAAMAANRGAAVVVSHAKRGLLPKVKYEECLKYLQGGTVCGGLAIPADHRVPARRAQGVDCNVALDTERELRALCARAGRQPREAFSLLIRDHALRTCRLVHSMPFYRLARFGWQPSVGPWDFAGVQRASLLWAALVGVPTSAFYAFYALIVAEPEDLVLLAACGINMASCTLGLLQLCADFARQLLELTQAEGAALEAALRAENRAGAMEQRLERELNRRVESVLGKTKGDARAALPRIIKLEKRSLDDRMDYLQVLAENPHLAA